MNIRFLAIIMAAVVACVAMTSRADAAKPPKNAAGIEFFEKKIRPVLVQHCYECHSVKSKIIQGNLLVDSRDGLLRGGDSGASIIPGNGDKSLLIAALRQEDGIEMPPKGKLPDSVIEDFVQWVDSGAADPRNEKAPALKGIDLVEGRKFWSYQAPKLAPPGELKESAWPHTEIDRYVLAALEAKDLGPVDDGNREMLIRRLSYDLTGLPPTAEEVKQFLSSIKPRPSVAVGQEPSDRDRRSRLYEAEYTAIVDRLLASPQFGERWGRHWLDVARYGESSGKERNVPYRMAWRYRDYVIDAFNADMPYDQFIREQIAGDLLPAATVEDRDRQLIATGFLTIGPMALTERVEEQFLLDVADEQLDTTCRAFLASTAGCARCHDHKFDPIPTTDYYALIGIFRSTENLAGVQALRREFSYSRVASLGDKAQRDGPSRELQQRIESLQKEIDKARNDQRAANKTKDLKLIEEVKAREADASKRMTEALAMAESDDKTIGTRFAMAVRDREQVIDYAVRIRGEVDDLGPVVPRGFLSVICDEKSPKVTAKQSGRLELAQWIASRDNPLTARVLVNRVWQHLFGVGLVESADNFGLTGDKPSHPELLDYLAIRFMDEDWSIKRLIREIVLSRTYQLSDQRDDAAYAVDPGNRLLWRFARRRLEAESIRDAILFTSGRLDLRRPVGSATLSVINIELGSSARIVAADDSYRYRAVYLPMFRSNVPEMLGLFDMADPSLVIGRREVTSVATQALYLMNSKFVMDHAKLFAQRVLEQESDVAKRIDLAYRLALTRLPSDAERRQIVEYIQAVQSGQGGKSRSEVDAWTDVCHALYGAAEFLYVH